MGKPVWFCSSCGNGPNGIWQVLCENCSHTRCDSCYIEGANHGKSNGGEFMAGGIYGESMGDNESSRVPRFQSHRSAVHPKRTTNTAQSGSREAFQSAENIKSSLEKKIISTTEDDGGGKEQKARQRLRSNHLHKPEIESEAQGESHGPSSRAQSTQDDVSVRFELGRYEAREKERAERALVERERERAPVRKSERGHIRSSYLEYSRYEAREKERAERALAEKEKERAAIREIERERKRLERLEQEYKEREERGRERERKRLERLEQEERERRQLKRMEQEKREREEQRAKDRKKEQSKSPKAETTTRPPSSRKMSSLMTPQEQAEQQRLLEADALFIQGENQAAEARKRERRVAARQQRESSAYYDPRGGGRQYIAQRTSEQALSSDTASDNKTDFEPHTEHKTIEPGTDTANLWPHTRHSETQSSLSPSSLHDTVPSSHITHDLSTGPDSGTNPSKAARSSGEASFSSTNLSVNRLLDGTLRRNRNIERAGVSNKSSVEDDDNDIGQCYPATIPASPSYASSVASVFSAGSPASSATGLSRSSGYSTVQIASATKVLLSVLQEDASLLPLYTNAMKNPHIGPDRLRRNLRRIFMTYSKELEVEAKERLEFLRSRLVMMKSGLLADSIVEKLQTVRVARLVSNDERKNESSDEDDEVISEAYPVNEEAFEDLEVFREFLVKSEAFQNLHALVQVFVTGKSMQTADTSTIEDEKTPTKDTVQQCLAMSATQGKKSLTWKNWIEDATQTIDGLLRDTSITNTANTIIFLLTDAFMLATDDIFIALGQLEPALKPGMTRLRWRCSCGDRLYSDVLELRPGGISELTDHMQRTSGVKVHVSYYDQQNNVQQYIALRPIQRIQNAWRKIWAALSRATQLSTLLPQYNTQRHASASTTSNNTTSSTSNNNASSPSDCNTSSTSNANNPSILSGNASSTPNNNAPQQNTLRLLACIHRDREYVGLIQDPLENVTTDRTLSCFLRRQYVHRRGGILRMVSLKSIKRLHLVKFWLTMGGKVIVDYHERNCVSASSTPIQCECLPPASKVQDPLAEYRCYPVPPNRIPPIPPEYLSSLITCPTDVHKDQTWILNQLPKRTCGELQGQIEKPTEGWGVYYQEDWDRDMITWAILILLIVAGLLFGILWSRFELDIQGAFGVSSYIMGVCAAFLAVVANHADKKR